jgi:hypothetical protein
VVDAADRSGIFAGDDPFAIARRWLAEAEAAEPNDPSAMALATVDARGLPNARMVLLKGIGPEGFVFYTNYESAKADEIEAAGKAAFVIHWKSLRRQIRARGLVSREDGPQAEPAEPARRLGVAAVAAAEEPVRADGRGGEGDGDQGHRPSPAAVLGRLPDRAGRDRVLGRRRAPAARPVPLDPRGPGRAVGRGAA